MEPHPGLAVSYGMIRYGTTQGFPAPMVATDRRRAAFSTQTIKLEIMALSIASSISLYGAEIPRHLCVLEHGFSGHRNPLDNGSMKGQLVKSPGVWVKSLLIYGTDYELGVVNASKTKAVGYRCIG